MKLLNFKHPQNTIIKKTDSYNGVFEIFPLEPGFGITIGNALRRVLLSSLEGYAVSSIKIEGITNEFSCIKGVYEDCTDLILNIKKIRFKKIGNDNNEKIIVKIDNKNQFKAGDINNYASNFEVVNKDLIICNIVDNISINFEFNVSKGRGYVLAEDKNITDEESINTIYLDSVYTPIKNVKYKIDNLRIDQKVDYEKLILDILTDGTISPVDALQEAANILMQHLIIFNKNENIISDENIIKKQENKSDNQSIHNIRNALNTKLSDLDFSVRVRNCLKAAKINTLSDLVQYNLSDMLKFRNFGKKSLTEIQNIVSNNGLSFGMNISKYIK
ncbi:MAG: DNA-directed RNA polymerase subunit alpha [Bacteroides sp.]|nr:MAG: DNA-directed RNA polymerase subunit alpha [Bacteroides sp.]